MRKLLIAIWLLLSATTAQATERGFVFVEQNTQQTTTSSTFVDISGMSIDSTSFTVGDKYLLFATCQAGNSSSNDKWAIQVVHGSTAFTESDMREQLAGTTWVNYGWLTVWTAVSSEGIKMQFASPDGSGTALVDRCGLLAMVVSGSPSGGLVENTDWFFGSNASSTALTTSFQDFASITFTPGTAGHDWLVCGYGRYANSAAVSMITRLDRSGEATSTTPEAQTKTTGGGTLNQIQFLCRPYNLGAASNTFKIRAADASAGTQNTHSHSAVFAIDLSKFPGYITAYTDAATGTLSTTAFATQAQTLSITPSASGNVWVGSTFIANQGGGNESWKFRIQIDNSDDPPEQTSDAYPFSVSANVGDKDAGSLSTVTSLTTAAHTIDLDMSEVSGSITVSSRFLWAIPMELPAVGGSRQRILGIGLRGIIQ